MNTGQQTWLYAGDRMFKYIAATVALFGLATVSAQGQAQTRDPLGGQFGVIERALSPKEAANDIEMMASAMAGLAPQRPGVTDTYVFVAGLWNDPVFEHEAEQVAAILGQRFDAADKTIILSAGTGNAVRRYPAASPNNIQAGLGRIGSLIDPNEDLVVVFLTSHGGPDGAMALQEKNRLGGALRAAHLRGSLISAGIRNKVVIISACYSGYFILPFSDPNTIVFTAAAADKTSFGCQPEREWTYFGDAFFNHALRSGASLVDAFDQSLGVIAGWEGELIAEWDAASAAYKAREPRPEASNPQKHVGSAVVQLLPRAERFGITVECAANLSVAYDRAQLRRPLAGAPKAEEISTARSAIEAKAKELGAAVNRTPQDVARAIAAANLSVLEAVKGNPDPVAASVQTCSAMAG